MTALVNVDPGKCLHCPDPALDGDVLCLLHLMTSLAYQAVAPYRTTVGAA